MGEGLSTQGGLASRITPGANQSIGIKAAGIYGLFRWRIIGAGLGP